MQGKITCRNEEIIVMTRKLREKQNSFEGRGYRGSKNENHSERKVQTTRTVNEKSEIINQQREVEKVIEPTM